MDSEAKSHGATFKAKLDLVEALGAEYYAYFHLEGTRVESEHLSEVAADAGLGEVPSAKAGETSLVARLNEMSEIREGDEIELWLDTRRLHLFDPDSGENLAGAPSGDGAAASAAKAAEKPVAERRNRGVLWVESIRTAALPSSSRELVQRVRKVELMPETRG